VPEGESVRLAILQAAWKRDRQVARRRLWWRWTLWGAKKYALPVLAVLGICAGLWWGTKATLTWLNTPGQTTSAASAAQAPSTPSAALESLASEPSRSMPPGMTLSIETDATNASFGLHRSAQTPVSSAAPPDAAETSNPNLISENWLHSKEP
jgi:hypothetical protein